MTALAVLAAVTALALAADNAVLRRRLRQHTQPDPYDWQAEPDEPDDPDGQVPTLEELLAMWDDPDTGNTAP